MTTGKIETSWFSFMRWTPFGQLKKIHRNKIKIEQYKMKGTSGKNSPNPLTFQEHMSYLRSKNNKRKITENK